MPARLKDETSPGLFERDADLAAHFLVVGKEEKPRAAGGETVMVYTLRCKEEPCSEEWDYAPALAGWKGARNSLLAHAAKHNGALMPLKRREGHS